MQCFCTNPQCDNPVGLKGTLCLTCMTERGFNIDWSKCRTPNCQNKANFDKYLCLTCETKDNLNMTKLTQEPDNPLATQIGGNHYKDLKIQPIEYIHANNLGFAEGSIVKYVSRWKNKGGIADLKKAKHFLELLITLETKKEENGTH